MKKDVTLQVDGLNIRGQLHLPGRPGPPYPAVILCHGVPTGIVDPNDGGYPALAKTVSREGFAVFTFSFRGTGASTGNFDIAGWSRDLETIIDYMWNLEEVNDSHLYLVGFSAGASVSIYVAAQDKRISGVVACACPSEFSMISEPGKVQTSLSYFRKIGIIRDPDYPASVDEWLNGFRKVNALHSIADIAPRPILLIHGSQDNVVPVEHSQKLYKKAGEPKQFVIIEAAEHRLRRNQAAVETVIKWLKERLG